jgi:hypothetical protein
MSNYITSNYIESSDTDISFKTKSKPNSNVAELLKKPIGDDSLKSYGLSKPRRVTVKARVIHDPS